MFHMCLAKRYSKRFEELVSEIRESKKMLAKRLGVVDKKISEMYHNIEVKKFNAAEGYYIAKNLQIELQKRRVIKHEMGELQSLQQRMNLSNFENQLHKSSEVIDKLKQYNDKYRKDFDISNLEQILSQEEVVN